MSDFLRFKRALVLVSKVEKVERRLLSNESLQWLGGVVSPLL